jgi:hypothetical protein
MPPHLIEWEPHKWKKDEWGSLSPGKVELIKFCRRLKITQTRRIAEALGIAGIYPSDDDNLVYKETRPNAWIHVELNYQASAARWI